MFYLLKENTVIVLSEAFRRVFFCYFMILNVCLIFNYDVDPPFGAQETLRSWQKKNHPWLELSDVHKETTENIRVTVIPFYMGYRESQTSSVYWVGNY